MIPFVDRASGPLKWLYFGVVMRASSVRCWILVAAFFGSLPAFASTQNPHDYGVYCVQDKLVVVQKPIEEAKCSLGDAVCRLEQDRTDAGARDKAIRLGGIGAKCTCEPYSDL